MRKVSMHFAVVTLSVFFALSANAGQLLCKGATLPISGTAPGTVIKGQLTAVLASSDRLVNVSLQFQGDPSMTPAPVSAAAVSADSTYRPRFAGYANYNRFMLQKGTFSATYVLLPKNASQLRSFRAYAEHVGSDGEPVVILSCLQN